jgi:hypothetical protein
MLIIYTYLLFEYHISGNPAPTYHRYDIALDGRVFQSSVNRIPTKSIGVDGNSKPTLHFLGIGLVRGSLWLGKGSSDGTSVLMYDYMRAEKLL